MSGRQQDQAKDAADVGPIDLLDAGDFRVGCVRVQLLSLADSSPSRFARRGRRPGSAFRRACSYQVDGAICRTLHIGSTPNSRMWASMKPITS
jgi:hypothetical protein